MDRCLPNDYHVCWSARIGHSRSIDRLTTMVNGLSFISQVSSTLEEVELFGSVHWMEVEWNFSSRYCQTSRNLPNIRSMSTFSFDPDPTTRHTVWSILFGATFTWLAIYGRCSPGFLQDRLKFARSSRFQSSTSTTLSLCSDSARCQIVRQD